MAISVIQEFNAQSSVDLKLQSTFKTMVSISGEPDVNTVEAVTLT
jgi:hypothetical protein